jgi:Ca2+-binding RTX toxin-like protein
MPTPSPAPASTRRSKACAGNDTLVGGAGADVLDGGAGFDTADYSSAGGIVVRMDGAAGTAGEANGDVLISIEKVIGSSLADIIIGSTGADTIVGGDGDDIFQPRSRRGYARWRQRHRHGRLLQSPPAR